MTDRAGAKKFDVSSHCISDTTIGMVSLFLGWVIAAVAATTAPPSCIGRLPNARDSVVVITHQVPPLHAATVRRFSDDKRFRGLPIVLINDFPDSDPHRDFSGLEPIAFGEKDRATVIRSQLGDISGGLIRSHTVYLAGGACGVCLTKTLERLLDDAATHQGELYRYVIFSRLTYGNYKTAPPAERFLHELLPNRRIKRSADFAAPVTGAEVFALKDDPAEDRVRLEVVGF